MIRTCTPGCTQPLGLNDPTETTASGHAGDEVSFWRGFNRRFSIETNYGILYMTRNAINATMWSHYGHGHTGLVIGIDIDKAGLNDESSCVLPAMYGIVIYTVSKPTSSYQQSNAEKILSGRLAQYDPSYIEALQRIFFTRVLSGITKKKTGQLKPSHPSLGMAVKFWFATPRQMQPHIWHRYRKVQSKVYISVFASPKTMMRYTVFAVR